MNVSSHPVADPLALLLKQSQQVLPAVNRFLQQAHVGIALVHLWRGGAGSEGAERLLAWRGAVLRLPPLSLAVEPLQDVTPTNA